MLVVAVLLVLLQAGLLAATDDDNYWSVSIYLFNRVTALAIPVRPTRLSSRVLFS